MVMVVLRLCKILATYGRRQLFNTGSVFDWRMRLFTNIAHLSLSTNRLPIIRCIYDTLIKYEGQRAKILKYSVQMEMGLNDLNFGFNKSCMQIKIFVKYSDN